MQMFIIVSTGVVNTITKLTKTCVVRITVSNIFFVISGKVANGGVSMWCELLQVNLYSFFYYVFFFRSKTDE